jgi:3-oxoacyl-[acyl-carrier-protein] synthase III
VKGLKHTLKKHGVSINDINYFLPHISSEFFKSKIYDHFKEQDLYVPYEKWFINLGKVGNVGAASIYVMVDELLKSGQLKTGDKILLLVPESARFSYMFGLLTVC